MPENFGGHEILNHLRQRICVTRRTLRALDKRGYLCRDRETGLLWIDSTAYLIFTEAERATPFFLELGSDCSGPNQVVCHCEQCKARSTHRAPDLSDYVVHDVTSRRRINRIQ